MTGVRFFSYLRTGLAASVGTAAVDGVAAGGSAVADVTVRVHADGAGSEDRALVPRRVRLTGPGEVIGLADTEVIREYPEPGATDAEPNYFPYVELRTPDLPWRYSTAGPDGAGKSPPWLVLVVVAEGDGVRYAEGGPLATLEVDDVEAHLPDLRQAWAWVHVQLDGDGPSLDTALADSPDLVRVRLLCPQNLRVGRTWRACLVPATRAGVDAGLRNPVAAGADLAWTTGAVTLPVYHSWRFTSGERGDFKALVQRLVPRTLPDSVGVRDLDISDAGSGLPTSPGARLSFLGAMTAPGVEPRAWPSPRFRDRYESAIRDLVNPGASDPADDGEYDPLTDDPVVAPPRYGAPQRFGHPVPEDERAADGFYATLNLDPRHRTVAALGFEVVRRDQESLLAAAWSHAASLAHVNRRLNRAALLARAAVARRVKFQALPVSDRVQISAPAAGTIGSPQGGSLRGTLQAAAVPPAVTTATFRRLGRPHGPLSPKVVPGGELPPVPSSRVVTTSVVVSGGAQVLGFRDGALPAGMDVAVVAAPAGPPGTAAAGPGTTGRRSRAAARPAPGPPAQVVGRPVDRDTILGSTTTTTPASVVVARPGDGPTLAIRPTVPSPPAASVWAAASVALDPEAGVRRSANARMVGVPASAPVPPRLRAAPVFTDPMYERLRALSPEYVVPGVGLVPENTVGVLEVNPAFAESFLVGLSHELSREFRWREYPAELWRTWFHRFWDTGPDGPPDLRSDIDTWRSTSRLGDHVAGGSRLVLLVKGDLVRRYPDVNVYAVRASLVDDVRVAPPGNEIRPPAFVGQLRPGVHFYGFDLAQAEAVGDDGGDGWFFALEEQPRGPRFGFDAAPRSRAGRDAQAGTTPPSWSVMTWAHLANAAGDPIPTTVDVDHPRALQGLSRGQGDAADTWAEHAAAMARITLRTPTRVLIHASALLPDAPAGPGPTPPKPPKPPKPGRRP